MNDRDFIELDKQGKDVNYFDPEIPKAIVKKSQEELVKVNKLVNGHYEKFIPSYIETFELKTDNNVESYKSYYKIGLALTEIVEFLEIFSDESVYDLDKSIFLTNLNSLKMLTDSRIDQIKKRLEGDIKDECK